MIYVKNTLLVICYVAMCQIRLVNMRIVLVIRVCGVVSRVIRMGGVCLGLELNDCI